MAESADALDSGSSRGNSVEVQVLLSAPNRLSIFDDSLFYFTCDKLNQRLLNNWGGLNILKAVVALIVTSIIGWIGMAIGFEFLGGFTEFGTVAAISIMGAFIIYFNEKKQ